MNKFKAYLKQVLIAFDQWVNALIGGWADETLSSAAHRMREKGQPVWGWTASFIDWLFRFFFNEEDHCKSSYESEIHRRQLPPELRPGP